MAIAKSGGIGKKRSGLDIKLDFSSIVRYIDDF